MRVKSLLVFALFSLFALPLGAQVAKIPLSVADVEELLRAGVSQRRVVQLIEERGVNFEVTGEVRDRLKRAGAGAEVVQSVEKIALEHQRRRLEEERKKADQERRRAEEERRKLEEERSRADEKQRLEKPKGSASFPSLPGYMDVEIYKAASGAFVNELQNKKVKVVANEFVMETLNLTPEVASKFVAFWVYDFNQSTSSIPVLIPKLLVDKIFKERQGRAVALYGQLVLANLPGRLLLVVERIEQ